MQGGLSRAHTLKGSKNFQHLRQKGKVVQTGLLKLNYLQAAAKDRTKVAIICPKHVGKAHERNLVRRRLREIIRLSPLENQSGMWLVVIVRHHAGSASYQKLKNHWARLAKAAQLSQFL